MGRFVNRRGQWLETTPVPGENPARLSRRRTRALRRDVVEIVQRATSAPEPAKRHSKLIWREWWCYYFHKSLELVEDRGAYQRVRCTKCHTEYGIYHDLRTLRVWRSFDV